MRRDSSYSSGGKTEDSLGSACVGSPRDNATAHRTWDQGRRSSSSSSSCPRAVGSATPTLHGLTPWGQRTVQLLQCTASLPWGQWAVELLQCTASLPSGSRQCNSCKARPHCLGAVDNATPAMHCLTVREQWAVQLLQCTASLPGGQCTASLPSGSRQFNSCNALPHCPLAVGSATPAMHCPTAWGQWIVQLSQCTSSLPGSSGQWNSCNALPLCPQAVGSTTPGMHCLIARGQRTVQLLQCTASVPAGSRH